MRRTLKRFDNTGMVDKLCFKKEDVQLYLLELVIENPGMYLTEMKKELHARGRRMPVLKRGEFFKDENETSCSEELRATYLLRLILIC